MKLQHGGSCNTYFATHMRRGNYVYNMISGKQREILYEFNYLRKNKINEQTLIHFPK